MRDKMAVGTYSLSETGGFHRRKDVFYGFLISIIEINRFEIKSKDASMLEASQTRSDHGPARPDPASDQTRLDWTGPAQTRQDQTEAEGT